ncbi:AraC family transcriptional regulator [Paenibacillus sp. HB172176]|uniref:AraC family transcriptional regulator n=1 Tax=Paenibacillus sp. HB172176 TaxID=2493690 RepID=UPI001439845B|nr:AraC family transcriptional regulator [Paenibacillus sp. HB172176]
MDHLKKINVFESKRRTSVFVTLFVSYMIILILPIVIGAALYSKVDDIMVGNADQANAAMLEQARRIIDSRMQEVESLTSQISIHAKLPWLLNQERYDSPTESYPYINFMKELQRFNTLNTFIDDYYIYFAKSDVILSPTTKTNSRLFFDHYYTYSQYSYEQYMSQFLQSNHHRAVFPAEDVISGNWHHNMLTFMQSLPSGESNNVLGNLVILVDEEKIKQLLANIDGMQDGVVYILDQNRKVLMHTSDDEGNPFYRDALQAMSEAQAWKGSGSVALTNDRGEDLRVTYTTSDQNGWTYVSVMLESVVLSQVKNTKTLAIIAVAICFVLGGVVCYLMAYRNYMPIRNLVQFVLKDKSNRRDFQKNEFQIINETVSTLFNREKKLETTISRQLPVIQADYLSRLIRGYVDAGAVKEVDLEFMGLSLPHPYFSVVMVDIDDCSQFIKEENERERALIRFVLTNVIHELLESHAYTIEMERNRTVTLLNIADVATEKGNCQAFALKLIAIMQERFRTKITVAYSTVHHGIEHIKEVYSEAVIAMDYKLLQGPSSVLNYEEVQALNPGMYHYPIEIETQLMNYTRNGDFNQVKRLLQQIYDVNFHADGMTPELGRCLFSDMLSTLLKLPASLNIEKNLLVNDGHDPIKQIAESKTAEEMYKKIQGYFMKFCEAIKEERTDHSEQLYRSVTEYIDRHFGDSMLSLALMANHFELNASYLSTFFKNYSGENITDYIAKVRVKEAKRLLAETSMTIVEIAGHVGYSSNIGLIRLFKKVEGVTPGQYRANAEK